VRRIAARRPNILCIIHIVMLVVCRVCAVLMLFTSFNSLFIGLSALGCALPPALRLHMCSSALHIKCTL
jgi:hypothetical protein